MLVLLNIRRALVLGHPEPIRTRCIPSGRTSQLDEHCCVFTSIDRGAHPQGAAGNQMGGSKQPHKCHTLLVDRLKARLDTEAKIELYAPAHHLLYNYSENAAVVVIVKASPPVCCRAEMLEIVRQQSSDKMCVVYTEA
jgi:hypothetical protein